MGKILKRFQIMELIIKNFKNPKYILFFSRSSFFSIGIGGKNLRGDSPKIFNGKFILEFIFFQ